MANRIRLPLPASDVLRDLMQIPAPEKGSVAVGRKAKSKRPAKTVKK